VPLGTGHWAQRKHAFLCMHVQPPSSASPVQRSLTAQADSDHTHLCVHAPPSYTSPSQLLDCAGLLYAELARYVLRILMLFLFCSCGALALGGHISLMWGVNVGSKFAACAIFPLLFLSSKTLCIICFSVSKQRCLGVCIAAPGPRRLAVC